jgi:dienelactone hydrolase
VYVRSWTLSLTLALLGFCGCSGLPRPEADPSVSGRRSTTTVLLHGKTLDLHLSRPVSPAAPRLLVVYASGDGGWFGAAVDMFDQIARAGYYAVGFSSRAFLRIERPRGPLVSAAQLAAEYEQVTAEARRALRLEANSDVVLSGWSRGAAFAVLVGAESPIKDHLRGVIAIGLAQGENLRVNSAGDDTDEGQAAPVAARWPFDTYKWIGRLSLVRCAVIQSTHDNYLPSARAQRLFGANSPLRRFYAVEASNHRFSGGKPAFDAALLDALDWIASPPNATTGPLTGGSGVDSQAP